MKTTKYGWSKEEIKLFLKLYPTESIEKLCKIFPNKNRHAIYSYATLKGIKKLDRGKEQRNGNIDILFNNSYQSLYWLGFLFADGCIHRNRLTVNCSKKDKNHLEIFAHYISSSIRKNYIKGGKIINKHPSINYCVSVCDPMNIKKLKEIFDFKERKTYNPPSIKAINSQIDNREKFISFLVGFIDGDGWIAYKKRNNTTSLCLENHASWLEIHNWFIFKLKFYGLYNGKTVAKLKSPSIKSSTRLNNKKTSKFQLYSKVVENIKKEINKIDLYVLQRKWYYEKK